jgi:hypothetical protein
MATADDITAAVDAEADWFGFTCAWQRARPSQRVLFRVEVGAGGLTQDYLRGVFPFGGDEEAARGSG